MKICFRCNKPIEEGSNYFSFTEFNLGSVVNVDYAYAKCWGEFLKQVGNVDEAMGVVRGMKGALIKMGLFKPEEYVVK